LLNFISQPPALESNVNIGPMSVRVGKGVVHTLTSAVSSFTQVINSSKQCFEAYWLSKAFKRIKGMTLREEVQKAFNRNMKDVTCGAGTVYPSGAPEFTLVFSGVCVDRSLVLCVMFCRSLFVLVFLFFCHCIVSPSSCCLSIFGISINSF
jgi:hypothetical protein